MSGYPTSLAPETMTEFSDKLQVEITVDSNDAERKLSAIADQIEKTANSASKATPNIDEYLAKLGEALHTPVSDGAQNIIDRITKLFDPSGTGKLKERLTNVFQELQAGILSPDRSKALADLMRVTERRENGETPSASEQLRPLNALFPMSDSDWEKQRKKAEKAFEKIRKDQEKSAHAGLRNVERAYSQFTRRIISIVAPLAGALSLKKLMGDYAQTADELGKQAKLIQMNVSDLYAYSKATEVAGGSAQAFRAAIERWVMTQHRSAEDFIELAKQLHGKSEAEQAFFLKIHGLSRESMQLFMETGDKAKELVETIRRTGLTEEDAKTAREFRASWAMVGVAVSAVGTQLSRYFMPILTRVNDFLRKMAFFIADNARFLITLMGVLSTLVGVRMAKAFIDGAKGVGILANAFKALGLAQLATPLGAISAAVIAIAVAIAAVLEDLYVFGQGGESLFEEILEGVGASKEEIESFRSAIQSIGTAFSEIWEIIKPLAEFLGKAFGGALLVVLKLITQAARIVAGGLRLIFGLVEKVFGAIAKVAKFLGFNMGGDGKPKTAEQAAKEASNAKAAQELADSENEGEGYEDDEERALRLAKAKPKTIGAELTKDRPGIRAIFDFARQDNAELAASSVVNNATTLTSNVNTEVTINGATDPAETARQVGKVINRAGDQSFGNLARTRLTGVTG